MEIAKIPNINKIIITGSQENPLLARRYLIFILECLGILDGYRIVSKITIISYDPEHKEGELSEYLRSYSNVEFVMKKDKFMPSDMDLLFSESFEKIMIIDFANIAAGGYGGWEGRNTNLLICPYVYIPIYIPYVDIKNWDLIRVEYGSVTTLWNIVDSSFRLSRFVSDLMTDNYNDITTYFSYVHEDSYRTKVFSSYVIKSIFSTMWTDPKLVKVMLIIEDYLRNIIMSDRMTIRKSMENLKETVKFDGKCIYCRFDSPDSPFCGRCHNVKSETGIKFTFEENYFA